MKTMLRYALVATAPVWAQTAVSPTLNNAPTREFGQPTLQSAINSVAPNLVEGRELYTPFGLAFDTTATPPILYVLDTGNNRVLAYKNPGALNVCTLNNASCGFADMVIGQRPTDLTATLTGGPGNPGLTAGFNFPTSIAVDTSGNLYVTDTGNQRILRFPPPFKQTGALLQTDLVIGQPSVASGNQANQGQPIPSAQTLSLGADQTLRTGIAFDSGGNLWVTDPGNNRVLRFPVSQLKSNTVQPAADLVLGQSNFTTSDLPNPPPGTQNFLALTLLNRPVGLAFDQSGNLYVSDNFGRILYFTAPFATNLSASRILGIYVQITPVLPTVNQYALVGPSGLFTIGNNLFVADAGDNRIVEYDIPANWPAAPSPTQTNPSQISPPMIAVIGQNDLVSGKPNKGNTRSDNSTLSGPFGAAFNGTDLWVADTFNNRILSFPSQGGKYVTASKLVGQLDFIFNAPNLIEGREVYFSITSIGQAGIAVDHSSNPPHLYIADPGNNRVLGFKDYRNVQQSSHADLVLGQPDIYTSVANSGQIGQTTQQGLSQPTGVTVDSAGNVYVTDTGNGRVLRYPSPFSVPAGGQQLPNLVLGQQSFTGTPITDPSVANMRSPFGVVLFSACASATRVCGLAVSDSAHNRVLIFTHAAGADFTNGQAASIVLGQQGFNNITASNAANGMNSPRHVSADSSDRLYVCDSSNGRVLIFNSAVTTQSGAGSSLQVPNLSSPQGIIVSQITGEAWVTDTGNDRLFRLPSFDNLALNQTPTDIIQLQTPTIAVGLDNNDNLIAAEAANRLTFFFPSLAWQNPANYNTQPLSPGMLALLYRNGLDFNLKSVPAQAAPLPTTLNDIQITVNGTVAPIFRIDQTFISFQVPSSTPSAGNATIIVLHPSTGEIIGTISAPMQQYTPGFFTSNASGVGLVAATNDDGTVNTSSNPISRGGNHFITFYLTGGGAFAGVPDGQIPSSPVKTADRPRILAGAFAPSGIAPDSDIAFSGSSFYPGVWQINFTVEPVFGVGNQVVAVQIGGFNSSIGPNPNATIQVYFSTK